jgi:hypothetical protein
VLCYITIHHHHHHHHVTHYHNSCIGGEAAALFMPRECVHVLLLTYLRLYLLHRLSHSQDCLAAQIQQPLLPQLHACLDNSQQLVTSCLAVQQFQVLMDMFSGPREQQRWQELLQRVSVYHCTPEDGQQQDGALDECAFCSSAGGMGIGSSGGAVVAAAGVEAGAAAGADTVSGSNNSQQQQEKWRLYTEPQRITRIDKLGKQQRAVFGLGDALQATTLTANGNAVRCCEQYGVKLEVVLHRPVWLAGM